MLLLLDRDDVPDEILVLVVDFLQIRTLSHTCRRAWQLLQRRYAHYTVRQQNVEAVAGSLLQSSVYAVHLSVDCAASLGAEESQHLASLREAPFLRTLSLDLWGRRSSTAGYHRRIEDAGAQALARLKEAPSLHTLCLDLTDNKIECAGVQALASLQDAPLLHTLHLDLSCNTI
jgi:hypothetical protein